VSRDTDENTTMRFFSPPPLAALSPLVTTGLDPVVHIDVQRIEQRGGRESQ